ncbi:hypothetical protein K2173_014335 [Erythroxylum novogranatense]|uniref:Uncharacterized protein n=1 Tax=Erythroxylum novogranatense TaxID=1862640 RepID=A0AAV8S630_9ROSI|nr:hypothetical protein K2173_014335 [Erythroxylum novogranatense]
MIKPLKLVKVDFQKNRVGLVLGPATDEGSRVGGTPLQMLEDFKGGIGSRYESSKELATLKVVEDTENAGSSEGSDYNNNHTPRNEYDLAVHEYGGFGGGLMDGSSTNIDVNEENENGNYLDEDDGDQGDIDVGEYINGDMDEGRVGEASGERNEDPDEGTGSTSSDFSDWGN